MITPVSPSYFLNPGERLYKVTSHFTQNSHVTGKTLATSQENATSLEMLFKVTIHFTGKCDVAYLELHWTSLWSPFPLVVFFWRYKIISVELCKE